MTPDAVLTELTHAIELAVAPVFLLMALGTFLNVFSGRLVRTVDRARRLNELLGPVSEPMPPEIAEELRSLARRRRLTNRAITAGTFGALSVCFLIVTLFVGFMTDVRFPRVIAALFIASMTAFIAALLFFLREISLAVRSASFRAPVDPR